MSKKAITTTPPPQTAWLTIVSIGLAGIVLGATLTYFALRPALSRSLPATALPFAGKAPTDHLPDPALTTGQSPVQADRTLGNFYYDHQNWPQAIQHYESAIQQGSDDADIRTDLGNAYRFTGRTSDALAQYERAQMMNPGHEFSLFNQGGLYLEVLHQPDKAVERWQEYLVRFPNGANVQAARQLIAQATGGAVAPGMPALSMPGASTAIEESILQRIQAGQTKSAKP